jgi:hypothetical protein
VITVRALGDPVTCGEIVGYGTRRWDVVGPCGATAICGVLRASMGSAPACAGPWTERWLTVRIVGVRLFKWSLVAVLSAALFGLGLYDLLYAQPYLAVVWFICGGVLLFGVLWALVS